VPCHGPRQVARHTGGGTFAGPLFPRRFTLPQQIGRLALQNPRQIYTILFQTAAETLLTIAADPKHLGASIGFLAVLHTWGQNLHLHPHLHCVVPGGGFSPDGSRWIACRKDSFFLPYKVLSRLFRKLFLLSLGKAFRKGQSRLSGELRDLAKPAAFQAMCETADNLEWVVHAKPPFGGPRRVLKYLARYTHRFAISKLQHLPRLLLAVLNNNTHALLLSKRKHVIFWHLLRSR
jgi:hypothetical protein